MQIINHLFSNGFYINLVLFFFLYHDSGFYYFNCFWITQFFKSFLIFVRRNIPCTIVSVIQFDHRFGRYCIRFLFYRSYLDFLLFRFLLLFTFVTLEFLKSLHFINFRLRDGKYAGLSSSSNFLSKFCPK